jgi:hypothetical protein
MIPIAAVRSVTSKRMISSTTSCGPAVGPRVQPLSMGTARSIRAATIAWELSGIDYQLRKGVQ